MSCILTGILYTIGAGFIWIGNFPATVVFSCVTGFVQVPILPATYPFTVLISQPVPPAIVNGYMMTAAQLEAFFMSFIIAYVSKWGQIPGLSVFAVLSLIAAAFVWGNKQGTPENVKILKA